MANDFIAIDIPDLEPLMKRLRELPDNIADAGIDNVNKYMLNVVRGYAPYKYVPFKQAYGGWFSEKQRRYVMARIAEGDIVPGRPARTQALSRGWHILGEGRNSLLVNEEPHALFVQGNSKTEQARMMKIIGWRGVDQMVDDRKDEILRRFEAGAKKAIAKVK